MGGKKRRIADRKVDVLAGIRLFGACSREELTELSRLFDEIDRPAGSVLVREGEPGAEFYVIVDGTATARVGSRTSPRSGPATSSERCPCSSASLARRRSPPPPTSRCSCSTPEGFRRSSTLPRRSGCG